MMKERIINIKWSDLASFTAAIGGMLSYFIGIFAMMWMDKVNTAEHVSGRGILLTLLLMGGLIFAMSIPALITKITTRDADEEEKIEREFEPKLAGCIEMEYCPDENPATNCCSFGTTYCPLEKERGDI